MKYKHIQWELKTSTNEEEISDDTFDYIANQIKFGDTSGNIVIDITNYDKLENLLHELKDKLGRDIDCDIYSGKMGELEELRNIAIKNHDEDIEDIIIDIFEEWGEENEIQ